MLLQEIKNIQTNNKILRNFGLLLSVFILIFAGISLYKGGTTYLYLFSLLLLVFLIAIIFPRLLKFIYIPWMSLAILIGFVITRIILAIFYYIIITPVALIMKLFGKDLLNEKIQIQKDSYWIIRNNRQITKEELKHQF